MVNNTMCAPAKINLFLDILGKRADGYHEMRMLNHSASLYDILKISPAPVYSLNGEAAEENLITRAAKRITDYTGSALDFKIDLKKNIPEQAGLAGGSADAAAALRLINSYKNLRLSESELQALALELGADVPYCLYNRPALVEGIGEVITPLDIDLRAELLILSPEILVSTPEAFSWVDRSRYEHTDAGKLLKALQTRGLSGIRGVAQNSFTPVISGRYPEIENLIDTLYDAGALYATMSGSGSSVVGYFENAARRDAAAVRFPGRKYKARIL